MKKKYFLTESEAICSILEPLVLAIHQETTESNPLFLGDRQDYIDCTGEKPSSPFFAWYQDTEIPCTSWQEALESAIWLVTGDVPDIWTRQVGKKWEAGLSNYDD